MPRVIAHRGASKFARENTIDAFSIAAEVGADAVELDVRRTGDGVLVIHHDPKLSDGSLICEVAADQLPDHVPTLDAALHACAGMWVNVEIKNDPSEDDFDATDGIADATIAALLPWGTPERWLISSFRRETIDRCRSLAPEIRTAWLCVEPPPDIARSLARSGCAALHPYYQFVTEALVASCHAEGVELNVWTCDDPEWMRRLAAWGVDGICTNVPDLARAVLGQ